MSRNPRIGQLSERRSLLKCAGRFREAIPLQLEIIELLEEEGETANRLASAHNMASVLCLGAKLHSSAEWHARRALELHVDESAKGYEALGAYQFVMARILASRYEFEDAVEFGEKAISAYARWHNPQDEFLSGVIGEVEKMRNRTWAAPE